MSVNPSSATMSTEDTNQFGSQKGSSSYLGLSNCSLKILEELQLLYEERMKTLDTEAAGDADRLKVQTLQSWVKDLGEQNGLLVRTVEELEREMAQRVMLLEEKFHMTSHETQKFMTQAEHVNNRLQKGRSSREFVSSAADSSNTLQDYTGRSSMLLESQVAHLKNDRENLCKLIQRGLETGNWSTKRFQFYEISDDDIFGPAFNFSNASAQHVAGNLKDTQEGEVYLQTELLTLRQNQEAMEQELDDRDRIIKENLSTMKSHIELKEQQICDLKQTIQSLQADTHNKPSTSVAVMTDAVVCLTESERQESDMVRLAHDKDITVFTRQLQEAEFRNEFMVREKERLADELASVHRELHFKVQEAAALTRVISDMDKASMDKQAALTAEVADKHDQISAMRREGLQLEEQCRQAAKQTTLKDSIIKEMRKEIKTNRAKISELEQNIHRKLSDTDRNKMHQQRIIEKSQDSNHLTTDNKDHIAVPKLCAEQSWPGYKTSKFQPGSMAGCLPQLGRCLGDHSELPGRYRGGTSPPSKDTQARGMSDDRAQIEEKDKLIAYLEARISTLQMAALPSQEIDQIFFNKDGRQSESSVTFVATRAENQQERSDMHEVVEYRELAERNRSALENVKKQMSMVLDREAVRENEISQHDHLLNIIHGNLTAMENDLFGFQQQYVEGAQLSKHLRGEIVERLLQLQAALTVVQETVDSSVMIVNYVKSQNDIIQPMIRADIELFSLKAMEGKSVFDNMKAEIKNLLYTLNIREKQSRDPVSVIDSLQATLQLTKKQLSQAHEFFLKERATIEQNRASNERSTEQSCSKSTTSCDDIDDYKTNLEQTASDEMKVEMNRLISTVRLRENQIADQEQTITELQKALKSAEGSLKDVQSKPQQILIANQRPVTESGDQSSSKVVKRVRGVCFAAAEIIEPQKADVNDDYQAFKNAELQLKEMSLKLNAREQHIRSQDEMIDALKTHIKQVELELKDLTKNSNLKCKSLGEQLENQTRVTDVLRNATDSRAEVLHRSIDGEMRPAPKMLRAASIEEFRVQTVEAQAALEDMMEETEALVKNLNLREDKLNILESIISLLQQTLASNEKEMIAFKERMDKEKQINDLHLLEREKQIKLIQEDFNVLHCEMNKSFEKLMSTDQKVDVLEYHTAAKVYQQTIDQITDKLLNGMHFVISQEEQIAEKEDTFRNIKEYLDQIQNGMRDFKKEVTEYLQMKEISDTSREESERKLEKWQSELENAQDELRRNVEHYQTGDYVSREMSAVQPRRIESTCRTSDARNYVYEGKDLDVRRAIERMKEQIDSLSDELDEQDQQNAECDRKLGTLKEQLNYAQSQAESPQQKLNNEVLVTSLREQQSIIDEYCRKSKELEEELERTQSDLHIALRNVREKDELLHNSSKRSNDEANIVQEQLEQPQTKVLVTSEDLQKQIANQQITIGNLQEALLSTKQQLEELQGKGACEANVGSTSTWPWPKNGHVARRSVHDV